MQLKQILKNLTANRYHNPVPLRAGSEGSVWRVESRKGPSPVAMKVFPHTSTRSFYSELRILQFVRHPNLLSIHDFFQIPEGNLLVLEYCSGGSLRDTLNAPHDLSWEFLLRLGSQVASALTSLHAVALVHGDVKPENILRRKMTGEEHWKLADYGIASDRRTGKRILSHTRGYAAPEVLVGKRSEASDIWSLGKVLNECFKRLAPYEHFDSMGIKRDVEWLIHCMMREDVGQRPKASDVQRELNELGADELAGRYLTPDPEDEIRFAGEL